MFLSRRAFLGSSLAALAFPRLARAAGSPRHLIVVFADGGWDVTYLFDPKLGVPTVDGPDLDEDRADPDDREYLRRQGDLSYVANNSRRPAVNTFFDRWASQAAIVNGIWVGSIAHQPCAVRMLTGTRNETSSDVSVIAGASLGLDRPIPQVDMGGVGFTGSLAAYSGQTGKRNQLKLLLDREMTVAGPREADWDYPLFVPHPHDSDAVRAWLQARRSGLAGLPAGASTRSRRRLADYEESISRAAMIDEQGAEFADVMQYGLSPLLSDQLDVAVDMILGGLCHSVALDSGSSWDTHDDNAQQHASYDALFVGLAALMDRLQAEDLLQSTAVVVLSEMGRTPRLNENIGKDHWPTTSALLLGSGLHGGRVYGGTDDNLDCEAVDLASGELDNGGTTLRYDHFATGLLQWVGVDPGDWLDATPLGGPFDV